MSKVELTQEVLKELLHYNPETGVFTWRKRKPHAFKKSEIADRWNARYSGTEAGCVSKHDVCSYIKIRVFDTLHYAHRLAWLYVYGRLPKTQIDHIDRNWLNNKLSNLRAVSDGENKKNKAITRRNKTGVMGVSFHKYGYIATIGVNRETIYLGLYDNLDDAREARRNAERQYGFHVNHGIKQ